VRTIPYRTVPVQTASLAPMPMLVPIVPPAPQPAAGPQPSANLQAPIAAPEQRPTVVASAAPTVDLRAPAPQAAPAAPVTVAPPAPAPASTQISSQLPANVAAKVEQAPLEADRAEIADAQPAKLETAIPSAPIHVHGGWLIQIGAFDDENDAKQHLSAAQIKLHAALGAKDPFTERVQKGDKALFRARFAGFDKQASAEAVCRELKRSDFQCMALKD
jgi:D-alanyl-D-alanine carboxypeptidase